MRIQLLGSVIVLAIALFLFAGIEGLGSLGAGLVGVSLSYGLQLSNSLQMLVRSYLSLSSLSSLSIYLIDSMPPQSP